MEPEDGLQMPVRMLVPLGTKVDDIRLLAEQGWEWSGETEGDNLVYVWSQDA